MKNTMDDIINKAQTPATSFIDELHSLRLEQIKSVKNDCLRGKYKESFDKEFSHLLSLMKQTASTLPDNMVEVKTKIDFDDTGAYNELSAFVVYNLFREKLKALDKRFDTSTFFDDENQLTFRVEWPMTEEEENGL